MKIITLLGSGMLLLPMGVLIGALFLWAGYRRVVWFFAITMGGAVALEHILKATFHRLRPAPFFDIAPPSSYSFPSGHALASFCFYGVLVALWSHRLASRAQRTGIWLVAAILIALIGVSRIYLGVHYPSDVIAGYAAALVWVMVMSFADEALRKRTRKRRGDEAHASLR